MKVSFSVFNNSLVRIDNNPPFKTVRPNDLALAQETKSRINYLLVSFKVIDSLNIYG